MNRCNAIFSRTTTRRLALTVALLGLSAGASAQMGVRPFPPDAQRGAMVVVAPPIIQLGGKPDRLSPGARIRGVNNMLLMSGALIGQTLVVNYVRNPTGEVHEVWVLSQAEAALKLPTQQ